MMSVPRHASCPSGKSWQNTARIKAHIARCSLTLGSDRPFAWPAHAVVPGAWKGLSTLAKYMYPLSRSRSTWQLWSTASMRAQM